MLPLVLSADLCSLRGGTDRLAVSVLWEMDADFNIVSTWLGRTAITNAFAMSYEDAQLIIDADSVGVRRTRKPLSEQCLAALTRSSWSAVSQV